MIVIVSPGSERWVKPMVTAAMELGPVHVIEPWKRLAWRAANLPSRAWARGKADRLIRAQLARRQVLDSIAAQLLPHGASVVVAPGMAARRTLAAARQRGARTVLIQDLPAFRRLHADLDQALSAHPGCLFLRRYRASARAVARQETEWAMADRILTRGAYAADALHAAGVPWSCLDALDEPAPAVTPPVRLATERPVLRILLAGAATARNGTMEAAAAIARIPGATLLVRPVPGMEPADLLQRSHIEAASPSALQRLEGVDAVLAPAWCETNPHAVRLALAMGHPLVATRPALGFAMPAAGAKITCGDISAMVHALHAARPAQNRALPPLSCALA
ncbi:MAG: hypothetical protein ACI9WU_002377 [Myxococcota bacterium]|jgi:hypothetical protein